MLLERIQAICRELDIAVTPAFRRRTPERYAIAKKNEGAWKSEAVWELLSRTAQDQASLRVILYALQPGAQIRILDLEKEVELRRRKGKTFVFAGSIALEVLRDAKEVVALIKQAFRDVRRGAITLTEAGVIDSYGYPAERQAPRLLDTESHWTEIPDSRIEMLSDSLPHLDPPSWRFYIPAYLIWSIKVLHKSDSMSIDSAIYSLYCLSERFHSYDLQRWETLSWEQSHAVFRFLQHLSMGDPYDVFFRHGG